MFNYNNLINMKNSLEPIVFNKYPKLKRVKLDLEKSLNPIFVRMTGSGSAIAAYFQSKERCEHAKKALLKSTEITGVKLQKLYKFFSFVLYEHYIGA